jgi:hypothetical protein
MSTWAVVAASHAALTSGSGTDALHAITSGAVGGISASAVLTGVYYMVKVAPGGALRARLSGLKVRWGRDARQMRSTRDYFAEWAGAKVGDTFHQDDAPVPAEVPDQADLELVGAAYIPAPVGVPGGTGTHDEPRASPATAGEPAAAPGAWIPADGPQAGILGGLGERYAAQAGWQPYALQVGSDPYAPQVGSDPYAPQVGGDPYVVQIGGDPYAVPAPDGAAFWAADENLVARPEDERLAGADDEDHGTRSGYRGKRRTPGSAPRHAAARGAGFASRMSARLASVRG